VTEVAYVALGANLGDPARQLEEARHRIERIPEVRIRAATEVEQTAPIGPPGQPPYLNQMIAVETSLTPHDLLAELLQIERDMGRVRGERWGPRTIDLDIVRFGELTVATEELVVPHPELPNRDFWQRQLAALDPSVAGRSGD
jgi:2-amino-4-hydroxy-6-hydroxymethyldihydropteridine diphosphokinase